VQHVAFGAASVGFKVNAAVAAESELQRNSALRQQKRLILVLDLDQTMLHTVSGLVEEGEDLHHFPQPTPFTTCLRPHLHEFLESLQDMYEMYVYTMGTRRYAELMVALIDPQQTYFRQRIISK
jgi:RNA polymerase II subunit A-like phosphatase